MNKVILSGNLCRDIELKQTQGGKFVLANCVAVSREYKNANGGYDSDFINIVAWDQKAEYLSRYASKGDMVELVGRWQTRKYTADDSSRTVNECIVEGVRIFKKQKAESGDAAQYTNTASADFENLPSEHDLPF